MRKRSGRKLLVASIGVAAVSYVACGPYSTVDNPPPVDGSADMDPSDAARDAPLETLVANLMAPPAGCGN